jgi:hypothetical protein
MIEFDHTVTQHELETFAREVLGKTGLSLDDLNSELAQNPLAWKAWQVSRDYTMSHVLVSKEVSMDVSTDDDDAGNRIFGTVIGVMPDRGGVMILVEESHRNFDQTRLEHDAAIGSVVWNFIDRMSDHCERDPADRILDSFVQAVWPHISASIKHINQTTKSTKYKQKVK